MSAKPENLNDVKNDAREYIKLTQMHELKLAFTLVEKNEIKGSVRKDRDTKQVLTDKDGNELRYPSKFKITITYRGGEMSVYVTEEQFKVLVIDELYLGIGRLAHVNEFGNTVLMPQFNSITVL